MTFRPMLAATVEDLDSIEYPVWVSPKIDGIRCWMKDGRPMSRSGKVLPNKYIQDWAMKNAELLHGFDGELVVGMSTASDCYNTSQSGVMSQDGEPDFTYIIFDNWLYPMSPYKDRYELCIQLVRTGLKRLGIVDQFPIQDARTLGLLFRGFLDMGFEGAMIRSLAGRYKNGRSTLKEGLLLKMKPWKDSEAEILEVYEMMRNENEEETDELGYTRRSSSKAGLVPAGTFGGARVRDIHNPTWEFDLGPGQLARSQQDALWRIRKTLPGLIVKYKYFDYGIKNEPRQPILLGFRTELDL